MANRFTDRNGHNVVKEQYISVLDMKHELVSVAGSTPSWGSQSTIKVEKLGHQFHSFIIDVGASAITGLTGSVANFPNYNPAALWIKTIDIKQGGNVQHTVSGKEIFLLNNTMYNDDTRQLVNNAQGDYKNAAQRNALAVAANRYYIDLWTYLNQCHPLVLYEGQAFEIIINWNEASTQINQSTLTGVPSSSLLSVSILSRVSKLSDGLISSHKLSLAQRNHHYKFLETRYQSFDMTSGTTSIGCNLSTITGNVAFIMFVITPVASLSGSASYSFTPCRDFAIVDESNNNLVGGLVIPSNLALTVYAKEWLNSTYTAESGANVYLYSFCTSPSEALSTGVPINTYRFTGKEQLVVNFASSIPSNYKIEVWSYVEAVLNFSQDSVNKTKV